MNLHEMLLSSKMSGKNNGNVDLSDYYTKSQTESLISEKTGKVSEQVTLNSSTLGYQRKNMLKLTIPPSNKNGVSFSIADGVVTLTGTATANADCYFPEYIYSLTEADTWLYIDKKSTLSCYGTLGTLMVAYYAPNVEHTATNRVFKTITENSPFTFEEGSIIIGLYIKITANTDYTDKTLYSMLRYAEITDNTYEPYKPSIAEYIASLESRITALESTTVSSLNITENSTSKEEVL